MELETNVILDNFRYLTPPQRHWPAAQQYQYVPAQRILSPEGYRVGRKRNPSEKFWGGVGAPGYTNLPTSKVQRAVSVACWYRHGHGMATSRGLLVAGFPSPTISGLEYFA